MKNFKLILKSLINNEACVEGGRHRPWYLALISFVLSMVIAVIPILVQTATKSGSQLISSTSYGVEKGLQRFIEDINEREFDMIIKTPNEGGSNYLNISEENWKALSVSEEVSKAKSYTYENVSGFYAFHHLNSESKADLDIFFIPELSSNNDELTKIINNPTVDENGNTVNNKRTASFIVFTRTAFVFYLYNNNSTSASGQLYGNYQSFEDGYNIRSLAKVTIEEKEYTSLDVPSDKYNEYQNGLFTNWKSFLDTSYLEIRGRLTWQTTLLMAAINAALVLFMGLMIWILTRGKNNPFKIYKFYECEYIAGWASLSPAILTVALGFMFSQFANIVFPLILGVRVMWLSMKTLKPQYSYAPEQNKKKEPVKTVDVKSKEKKAKKEKSK